MGIAPTAFILWEDYVKVLAILPPPPKYAAVSHDLMQATATQTIQ